ncbi:MAG: ester cyclase [Candidatus Dormiibacterota bacterium]
MSEQNKALARRGIEEVFNQGKFDVVGELVARNAVFHDPSVPGGKFEGPEGFKQFTQIYRNAFPDIKITINDQVAEGDKVVTRWTGTGTHKGELMGIAPTGKYSTVTGISFERYENGKLVESWANYDNLGMLQQLGVVPSMTPAGAKA